MKAVLICLVLIAIISILLANRQKPGKKQLNPSRQRLARTQSNAPPPSPYRATSITSNSDACEAAKSLRKQRFLLNDTPKLPLAGCNSRKCNCTYLHHEDRRDENSERRSISNFSGGIYSNAGNTERREAATSPGRRSTDKEF